MPKKVNEEIMDPDHCGRPAVGLMQLFLKVNGDSCPQLVAQPADKQSYPANLVILNGCVIESKEDMDEQDCWVAAGKVADMCRSGWETIRKAGMRNAICDHLDYAYRLLCDYADTAEGGRTLSDATKDALLKAALARIEQACTCVDFALDKYGTED